MTTAGDLVATVRGRRLCFELAQRAPGGEAVYRAVFEATFGVHEQRGDLARGSWAIAWAGSGTGSGAEAGAADTSGPPPAAGQALVDALVAVDASTPSPATLLAALSDTVASAMGWQPPHAEDVVLARAEVRAALLPIAEAALRAPAAAWWSQPLDRTTQVDTRFEDAQVTEAMRAATPTGPAAVRLSRWREAVDSQEREAARFRVRHPHTSMGGQWWVTPATIGLAMTTRTLGDAGSAALWLTEDELGWEAADLVPCAIDPAARLLEITGPGDWSRLAGTYPLDVTASRAPEWWGAVPAREGRWLIPDWSAVARDHDAVHVSVLAWLLTSGEPVPAGPGAWTTLAGWDPDATWWLADSVTPDAAGARWEAVHEGWSRA